MFYDYAYQLPEVTRASENGQPERVSVSFNLNDGYDWQADLPAPGSYISPYGYYTGYILNQGPGYPIIRMNFSSTASLEYPGRDSRKAGDVVWAFHLFTYDRDLRLHPLYKTIWNYSLAISQDVSTEQANSLKTTGKIDGYDFDASTATDITIQNKELRKKIRWVQEASELPESWSICIEREFTFDAYKSMTGTVTRTTYYSDVNTARKHLSIPASLECPKVYPAGTSNLQRDWMIEDSSANSDGDLAVEVTTYQYYEDSWSEKIYG